MQGKMGGILASLRGVAGIVAVSSLASTAMATGTDRASDATDTKGEPQAVEVAPTVAGPAEASTDSGSTEPAFSLASVPVSSSLFGTATSQDDDGDGALLQIGSKYPITFSGFIKADAFWTNGRVNSRDTPQFATADPDSDEQFDATVQFTRLVLDWDGPEILYDGKVDAKIEVDLRSLSGDDFAGRFNNSRIATRQLYVNLTFDTWSVLAGQTWDVFSPLNVDTLNTEGNLWFGGNAGFRRPQLRLEKWFDVTDEQRFSALFSVNANIGIPDPMGNEFNTGNDSGKPVLMGAVRYSLPFLTDSDTTIGVSGLIGEEEVDGLDGGIDQIAYGADLTLPITEQISFKAEWQHGENTDSFLLGGGFDATFDPATGLFTGTGDETEVNAGWGQLSIQATEEFLVNFTLGQERFTSGSGAGGRDRNTVFGGNLQYSLSEDVIVGAEYTHFDTEYNGASDEQVDMIWASLIFNF